MQEAPHLTHRASNEMTSEQAVCVRHSRKQIILSYVIRKWSPHVSIELLFMCVRVRVRVRVCEYVREVSQSVSRQGHPVKVNSHFDSGDPTVGLPLAVERQRLGSRQACR